MHKSGKFNQRPVVAKSNQYEPRYYKCYFTKPAFLAQRTRTWKNKSRLSFAINKGSCIAGKSRNEPVPAAILGTKRADELIAAQKKANSTLNEKKENSRPILGRKYDIRMPEHSCELCAKTAIADLKLNANQMAVGGAVNSCPTESDNNDDGLPAAAQKIQTMTFTNKVGSIPQQTAAVELEPPPKQCDVKVKRALEIQGSHYDMCSVWKYALQIMKSDAADAVTTEINSTDTQKLMAVHKRLLSMAIWNNNEEIFDESQLNDIDEGKHDTGEQELTHAAKPDTLILNSYVFFANGKSLIAPPASALPMPPKRWIQAQMGFNKQ